ncbi:MAG: cytochrome c-type biogenesis protein CcmH [Chloroflexota bacterium]|nr:cytochrome c-type biogenesis protein CcmH [Chloroflexota bacterium]
MRRLALPIAAAALVALLGVITLNALRPVQPVTRAESAAAIAAELRCPDCQSLSVADSHTPSAIEIRRQIDDLLAGGAAPDAVRQHFVDRYGEWILLAPRSPLAWALPFLAILVGLGLLVIWLRPRRRAGDDAVVTQPAGPEAQLRRVRDEAEAIDG